LAKIFTANKRKYTLIFYSRSLASIRGESLFGCGLSALGNIENLSSIFKPFSAKYNLHFSPISVIFLCYQLNSATRLHQH
jgi:hypothetical protein